MLLNAQLDGLPLAILIFVASVVGVCGFLFILWRASNKLRQEQASVTGEAYWTDPDPCVFQREEAVVDNRAIVPHALKRVVAPRPAHAPQLVDAPLVLEPYPGTGPVWSAVKKTPTFDETMGALKRQTGHRKFVVPLGWSVAPDGQARLFDGSFDDQIYNALVVGQNRRGKDILVANWLFALMRTYDPSQVKIAIMDGKGGLDFNKWDMLSHVWRIAIHGHEYKDFRDAIVREHQERQKILSAADVTNWNAYVRGGGQMPLLIVYISELSLLKQEKDMSKDTFNAWVEGILRGYPAFGIRFIISTQNASGDGGSSWRAETQLKVAAYLNRKSHVEPNMAMPIPEIEEAGVTPPNKLPHAESDKGIFTLILGNDVANVRSVFIDDDQRRQMRDALPMNLAPLKGEEPQEPPRQEPEQANGEGIDQDLLVRVAYAMAELKQEGVDVSQNKVAARIWENPSGRKKVEVGRYMKLVEASIPAIPRSAPEMVVDDVPPHSHAVLGIPQPVEYPAGMVKSGTFPT